MELREYNFVLIKFKLSEGYDLMTAILNIPAIIEDIYSDSKVMYKTISELEDFYRYGRREEYSNEESELEDYLNSKIESIHTKLCLIMEFYKLDRLYEEYISEYNGLSNTTIKYYADVDVFDSPVYSVMNKYIRALSFIGNQDNINSIVVRNDNNVISENNNRNDTKINIAILNKIEIDKIISLLNEVEIDEPTKNEEYKGMIQEIEDNTKQKDVNVGLLKKQFGRISDFLSELGQDIIKDEFKTKIFEVGELISKLNL